MLYARLYKNREYFGYWHRASKYPWGSGFRLEYKNHDKFEIKEFYKDSEAEASLFAHSQKNTLNFLQMI